MTKFPIILFGFLFSLSPLTAAPEGPGPDQALVLLKEGHKRFLAGALTHPNQDAVRRQATAKGQTPYAAILGCADSRESLDILFDAGIGDLFTIRVAGNVADTDEIASLEYGAEHLKTPLILVLGHTSCGAVTAVVKKAELAGQLPALLDNINAPAARALAVNGPNAPDLVDKTARENVFQSIQDMLTRSKILSELVEKGELKVAGGLYHLDTGEIDWLETPLSQASWVSTGLMGVPPTAPVAAQPVEQPWTDQILPDAGAFFAALVLLSLVQLVFVSERRWVTSVKFRGRLMASFVGLALALGLGTVVSFLQSDPVPFLLTLAAGLIFSVVFARSHYQGFHRFYGEQKKKWEKAQTSTTTT